MGREIFYCANCGARILPEEFESGEAIALNNQNYCPNCKAIVAPEMPAPAAPAPLPEDIPTGSSALRRAVKAPLPTMTTGRGGTGIVGRHQTTSPLRVQTVGRGGGGHASSPPAQKNNTVIIAAAVGGALLLILILALASGGGRKREIVPPGGGGGGESRPPIQQPTVPPPGKADFERLKSEAYELLRKGKKIEARGKVDAYKIRFTGHEDDKLQKLSDEVESW